MKHTKINSRGYRKAWENYHKVKIPVGWHVHHITPKCYGGTDIINNLVACPPKAHVKFHLMDGDKKGATGAWNMRNGLSDASIQKMKDNMPVDKIRAQKIARDLIKLTCSHCGKKVDTANFGRWHGTNCSVFTGRPNDNGLLGTKRGKYETH